MPTRPGAAIFSGNSYPTTMANRGLYIEFFHLVSGTSVRFPAFLTQFEDQWSSEWNEETVFGRMDPISTFKRTMRKINLGWEIAAESGAQARENIANISALIQMLYPSYDRGEPLGVAEMTAATEQFVNAMEDREGVTQQEVDARLAHMGQVAETILGGGYATGPGINTTHISGPPLMKIRFVNLIKNSRTSSDTSGTSAEITGLLGYVGGFTNAPMLDVGFIEDQNSNIYPKSYAMSCTFTVLHEHDLGWDREGNFRGGAGYPYRTTPIPSPAVSAPARENQPVDTETSTEEREEMVARSGGPIVTAEDIPPFSGNRP